jgi:hypothetical protein
MESLKEFMRELGDLPAGRVAERDAPDDAWRRVPFRLRD